MFYPEKKELNKNNVLGIILSGGLSTRMGEDKSIKKISGKSLLEHVIFRSSHQVDKLIINSNKSNKIFKKLGMDTVINDCIPGSLGPLIGVLSGLKWARKNSDHEWLVSFPVDCPFFPKNIVKRFIEESGDYKIVLAESSERLHPVFSMWRISENLEGQLESFLVNGERKIEKFTKKFKTRVVKFSEVGYDPFFNVNTMIDLEKAEKIYNQYQRRFK